MITRIIFSILSFGLFNDCYSQKDTLKEYFHNGTLKKITPRLGGKKNGFEKTFSKSGKIKEETPYLNDTINGIQKGYNIIGELYYESPYINGKINGVVKHYFSNGNLMIETPWTDNKICGTQKWYYKNGVLKNEKPHIKNHLHGITKYYFESGKILEERHYIDGRENGIVKLYYESGEIKSESPYVDGQINGIKVEYDKTGEIVKETRYTDGFPTDKKKDRDVIKKASTHQILYLTKTSNDIKYGFAQENPIKVGCGIDGGPSNQISYLNLLLDAKGNPIKYKRLRSCCDYKSKNGLLGIAKLDQYQIIYLNEKGEETKRLIYITFYDFEEPQILFGFKTIKEK